MAANMLEGTCPYCGNTLQIPEELRAFSCLYCGKRMCREDLMPTCADETTEEVVRYVRAHILACIDNGDMLRQGIQRAKYEDAFARYEEQHREVFCRMDSACQAAPARKTEILADCVHGFLEQLEERWASGKKDQPENDKIVIALYLVPAIRHLKLSCGEEFCTLLHTEWMRRYPKNPFQVGDYETMMAGFNRKPLGLCFITTAVCEQEGKPDDCEELTAFRSFRDGYLRACSDGPELIETYYEIAPAIVTVIGVCGNPDEVYSEIRERWLNACYSDLKQGRMEACKARYTEMVRTLEARYLN